MKNYRLDIYFTDKLVLREGITKVFADSVFFEKVTCKIIKSNESGKPFDTIKFFKNGKVVGMFFPNSSIDYDVVEVE